ncbi:MAG: hypothetical protein U1E94_06540 [Agitococcus sp.]
MRFFIFLIALYYAVSGHASQNTTFKFSIDTYSAPVSIHAFTSDWHDDLKSGDNAFLHGLAELSIQNTQRKLSLLWRYDYLLDFDEQTAQLYHAYANDYAPKVSTAYPLHIKAKYSESYGVQWLQKFHFKPNITLGIGLSLLKGYKITDGQLDGTVFLQQAGFKVKDIQQANANVNYYYDEPQLQEEQLDWHPRNPSAMGFSINTTLIWQLTPQWLLNAQIDDIYGRLYWKDIPTTQYNLSCKCSNFIHNIDGQLAVANKYTQHLQPLAKVQLSYSGAQNWHAELNTVSNTQMTLVQGAWGYQYASWQGLLLLEPQTHAIGIELRHPNWHLRWLTDNLNSNQAHRLGLSLGVNKSWY